MSKNATELASILKSYSAIISKWPKDRLRPNYCLSQSLKLYAQENFESANTKNLTSSELAERIELGRNQLSSLENILANKSKKKYPVSGRLTRPESDPAYYTKLLEHVDQVVDGKAKRPGNWFINFLTPK